MTDYDFVVVGAGIAGLMTSKRLADMGYRVCIIEAAKVGSGGSVGNHGIIHAGTMYAELHPEVVAICQEASRLFSSNFPDAMVSCRPPLYFAKEHRVEHLKGLWTQHKVYYEEASDDELQAALNPERSQKFVGITTREKIVSPREVLIDMVCACLRARVDIFLNTSVKEILTDADSIVGVAVGIREIISTRGIILCCGLGTSALLEKMIPSARMLFKSRLGTMVALGNRGLDRPVFSLQYGGPTIVPTRSDKILASLYGGTQPRINRTGNFVIPSRRIDEIVEQVELSLNPQMIDSSQVSAYMHAKTEVTAGKADYAGVEPSFSILDSRSMGGPSNLWSVVPGKLTLAFHASAKIVEKVTGERADIEMRMVKATEAERKKAEQWVEREPWTGLDIGP